MPIVFIFSSRQISAHPIRNFRSNQSTPGRFDNIDCCSLPEKLLSSETDYHFSLINFGICFQTFSRLTLRVGFSVHT